MNIKCFFSYHDPETVLNIRNNKLTKICKRCKAILEVEKGDFPCCSSCVKEDVLLRWKLKELGKVIDYDRNRDLK